MWHARNELPSEIVCEHVFPFLVAEDLGRLDSAAACTSKRQWLHQSCFPGTMLSQYRLKSINECEQWFQLRKFRFKELTVDFVSTRAKFRGTQLSTLVDILTSSRSIHLCNFNLANYEDLEMIARMGILEKVKTLTLLANYSTPVLCLLCEHCTNVTALSFPYGLRKIPISLLGEKLSTWPILLEVEVEPSWTETAYLEKEMLVMLHKATSLTKLTWYCSAAESGNFISLLQQCPCISTLKLTSKTDDVLYAVASHCSWLQQLHLQNFQASEESLARICQHCPRLSYLHVEDSENRSTLGTLMGITTHAKNLVELFLPMSAFLRYNMNADTEPDLPNPLPLLRLLTVRGPISIPSAFAVARIAVLATHVTELTIIAADLAFDFEEPFAATDLAHIAKHCHNLQRLEIEATWCEDVTDAAVTAILQSNPHLRSVHLVGAFMLGDPTLQCLATSCPHLEELSESSWEHASDEGIAAVLRNCRYIRKVKLWGCPNITNHVLSCIPHSITHLKIAECAQFTGDAIVDLALSCRLLRELDVEKDYLQEHHYLILEKSLAKRCKFTAISWDNTEVGQWK